MSAKKGHRS